MTIDIIGAGIGGLTTSIALQQKGIKSRVFEQAEAIKPVGAGIILASNAMQVYEKLGLRKEIEKHGNPISCINITRANLQTISSVDLKYFEQKHKVQNVAIHRGKLQEILLSQLDRNNIKLDFKLSNVKKNQAGFELHFDNKETVHSEYIIGADGLHSVVRNSLFTENKIRNAKQICWRGLAEFNLPKKYQNELNEAWGRGDRFGMVQIAPQKVYWYALKSVKSTNDLQNSPDQLGEYFNSYNPLVSEIIESTPVDKIHTAEILDLNPIKNWHQKNVCLLGDAAHATTPNMGQGACQAIESAYVLSECLAKWEFNKAVSMYQKLRMPKAHQVVNASWTLGKVSHWENPLAITFRNALMKMTPQKISRKQSESLFQLNRI